MSSAQPTTAGAGATTEQAPTATIRRKPLTKEEKAQLRPKPIVEGFTAGTDSAPPLQRPPREANSNNNAEADGGFASGVGPSASTGASSSRRQEEEGNGSVRGRRRRSKASEQGEGSGAAESKKRSGGGGGFLCCCASTPSDDDDTSTKGGQTRDNTSGSLDITTTTTTATTTSASDTTTIVAVSAAPPNERRRGSSRGGDVAVNQSSNQNTANVAFVDGPRGDEGAEAAARSRGGNDGSIPKPRRQAEIPSSTFRSSNSRQPTRRNIPDSTSEVSAFVADSGPTTSSSPSSTSTGAPHLQQQQREEEGTIPGGIETTSSSPSSVPQRETKRFGQRRHIVSAEDSDVFAVEGSGSRLGNSNNMSGGSGSGGAYKPFEVSTSVLDRHHGSSSGASGSGPLVLNAGDSARSSGRAMQSSNSDDDDDEDSSKKQQQQQPRQPDGKECRRSVTALDTFMQTRRQSGFTAKTQPPSGGMLGSEPKKKQSFRTNPLVSAAGASAEASPGKKTKGSGGTNDFDDSDDSD